LAINEHMDESLFASRVPKLFTFMSLHYEYWLRPDPGSTESTSLEGWGVWKSNQRTAAGIEAAAAAAVARVEGL
jgi:hypothetical protein